jgi:hypothetical protein
MSGTNGGIPPIKLTLDGKDAVERGMDDIARAAERMAQRTGASAQQMGTLATVADDVGARLGTLSTRATAVSVVLERMGASTASQGLGTLATVLDGAALAASRVGANATAAEAGVSSFFARMATGVTVLGAVAAGLQAAGLGINAAGEGALRAADYSSRYQSSLEALNGVLGTTAQRAQEAALALFRTNQQAALVRGETALGQVFEQRSAGITAFNRAEAAIARQRAAVTTAEGRVAGAWSPLQRRAFEQQAETARAELNRLETERARLVVRNAELTQQEGELAARLQDARRPQGPDDVYGPPAPAAPTRTGGGGGGGGGRELIIDPESGLPQSAADRLRRLREAEERETQRTAEREQRELERREERNNRVTDRIVDYGAERFAELFDKNGRGWEGMLSTLESTAKSTFARLAAELILRPVIAPVVSALGLGQLGNGNGGFSGIGGLLGGGGGSAEGTVPGSGGGGLLGGLGQARSLFGGTGGGSGGGFLGNIGGYLNNPIYTPGAGWFAGTEAIAASQWSALGPGMYGPVSGAAPTSGLAGIGGASIAGYAAGIGGGYMIGSQIGRYTAGNSPARQQNAQIGAAGGAVAGAIIGSIIPGVGTVIGGLVGGAIGGGGGGLIGPGRGFSGGDVGIGVGADGLLTVTGAGGKRFDTGAAQDQTRAQLDQINNVLRAGGVTIGGMGTGTLGYQGFGESRNVFGPTEIFNRVRGNISSSNPTLEGVLRRGVVDSFDELAQVTDFVTRLYEPLGKVRNYADDFNKALTDQTAVYDQAIAKARELGLAEAGLVANRDRTIAETIERRDLTVGERAAQLRAMELRQSGNPADAVRAAVLENNFATRSGRVDLRDFLRTNGFDDTGPVSQNILDLYDRVMRQNARDVRSNAELSAGASGRSLMEDLTVGGLGGLAPGARYAAGLRVLQDARRSGNLDRITAAARTILPVAREYLGTSERFGALTADISRDVRRLGGDPVGLGVFLEGQAAGNQALERIYGLSNSQLGELKGMRAEIARLNNVLTTLMQRR